jgi:uncharacterized protein YndB with AHSA1/START domain
MGRIIETAEFAAPLERVWKRFTDPAEWAEWKGYAMHE